MKSQAVMSRLLLRPRPDCRFPPCAASTVVRFTSTRPPQA